MKEVNLVKGSFVSILLAGGTAVRVAAAAAATVLGLGLAACGDHTPQIPEPSPQGQVPGPSAHLFGPACAQLPQGGAPGSTGRMLSQPVASGLAPNPFANTFSAAVRTAGLDGVLNDARETTVFVPYDAAFADLRLQLGADNYNALLADQKKLADLLKNHVIEKRFDREGLVAAHDLTTLQGAHLRVADAGDTLTIRGGGRGTAHVLCGNVPAQNATIFFIDKVLAPATP